MYRPDRIKESNAQRVSMTPLYSTNSTNQTFQVLIKSESVGKVSATVLGLPEFRAEGSDSASAIAVLKMLLTETFSQAEIVSIDIAIPQPKNPWLEMVGRFKDDPHFDEVLSDIEAYRREQDAEAYASSHTEMNEQV
jgi:hypothetical protein